MRPTPTVYQRNESVPRVAVLGAGFQGTCVALELALRGVDVDLYDQNDACITQAGLRNEGKIHLGFVYANDASFETARLLAQGALCFAGALRRWLDDDIAAVGRSASHIYAVHRDSILSRTNVLAHFARVKEFVRDLASSTGYDYIGEDARNIGFEVITAETWFDAREIAAAIQTDERAVDVVRLAILLRKRVANEPRIAFHPGARITRAAPDNDAISISFTREGTNAQDRYRTVVNCLWDGQSAIDQQMAFLPPYPLLYRLKFGCNVAMNRSELFVPSTTFVVGSFGDVVQFHDRLYLSWYPLAQRGISRELTPPDWPRELDGAETARMVADTLTALARLIPTLRTMRFSLQQALVTGGIILAAGETDIDDPNSALHRRTSVGIRSIDGYHSVNTGKYTLAPMYAIEVADRICGTA